MTRGPWLAIVLLAMLAGCRQPMAFSVAVEGTSVGEGPLAVEAAGGGVDVPVDPLLVSLRLVAATDMVVVSDGVFAAESGPEEVVVTLDCEAPNTVLCDSPHTAVELRAGEVRTVDLSVQSQDGGELALGDYVLESEVTVRSKGDPDGDTLPMRLRLSIRIREYGGVVDYAGSS